MASRYDSRKVLVNDKNMYYDLFKKRGVSFIKHFNTAKLRYPTPEEIETLHLVGHTWTEGDKLYKLAFKYYGDSELWWIIAWYNTKHEFNLQLGDEVVIPLPLEKILRYLDV